MADRKHAVVEVGAAVANQYTAAVELEAHLIGLGNTDGTSVGHNIEEASVKLLFLTMLRR